MTKEEISEATGIPTGKSTGKVEPHIDYAILMGLIKDTPKTKQQYTLEKTELGKQVMMQDIGFMEEVSQLICHVRLTSKITGASLWSNIIRDILPRHRGSISDAALDDELRKIFSQPVNTGPFFSSYRNSFTSFNLINQKDGRLYSIPQRYNGDLQYVYAYALLHEWEVLYTARQEITSNELDELKFGAQFAWDIQTEFDALQILHEVEIIQLNRQLTPYTITRRKSSDDMIPLLYSLLL